MKKQRGRPIKPATGKRTQVTTLIRTELKRQLMNEAKENGRTLSAEIEHWLERLLAYERLAKAFANLQRTEGQSLRDLREIFASLVPSKPPTLRDILLGQVAQDGPGDDEDSKS